MVLVIASLQNSLSNCPSTHPRHRHLLFHICAHHGRETPTKREEITEAHHCTPSTQATRGDLQSNFNETDGFVLRHWNTFAELSKSLMLPLIRAAAARRSGGRETFLKGSGKRLLAFVSGTKVPGRVLSLIVVIRARMEIMNAPLIPLLLDRRYFPSGFAIGHYDGGGSHKRERIGDVSLNNVRTSPVNSEMWSSFAWKPNK